MMTKISKDVAFIRCGSKNRINLNAISHISWNTEPDPEGDYDVYIHWIGGGSEHFYLNQHDWEDFIHGLNSYCPSLSY